MEVDPELIVEGDFTEAAGIQAMQDSGLEITEEMVYLQSIQNSLARGEIDARYSIETIMGYANRIMEGMSERYWHFMKDQTDMHAGDAILDEMIHLLRYGLSSTNKTGQEAGLS